MKIAQLIFPSNSIAMMICMTIENSMKFSSIETFIDFLIIIECLFICVCLCVCSEVYFPTVFVFLKNKDCLLLRVGN